MGRLEGSSLASRHAWHGRCTGAVARSSRLFSFRKTGGLPHSSHVQDHSCTPCSPRGRTEQVIREQAMLGRLVFGGVRRAGSARPALTSSGRRKLGLAAGVAGFAGAAFGLVLGSPAQADGWRITGPAAEDRERATRAKMNSSQGFALPPIVVTISGAAGQIAYSEPGTPSSRRVRCAWSDPSRCLRAGLLPLICSGQVFGKDRPVSLRLLDIEPSMSMLRGVVMELEDAAYPLLENVYVR